MRYSITAALIVTVGWMANPAWGQDGPPDPPDNAVKPGPGRRPRPQRDEAPPKPQIPDSIELVRDVVYSRAPGADGQMIELKLDAASPKQSDQKLPAVIFVHGGGFRDGSKDAGIPLVIAFAQGGYLAVTIDYRLAGAAGFPAAVHDCKAAVRFLRANAKELGIDPWRIGIVGPSAGGYLSALIGTSGNDGALEGDLEPSDVSSTVQCVVDISGPIDFTRFKDGVRREYLTLWLGDDLQEYKRRAKEASPLTYIDDADPPFLLIHGTADEIVPLEQAQLFNAALIDAGIETEYLAVAGAGHALRKPELLIEIGAFFDRHLGGRAAAVFRKHLDQQPKPTDAATLPMKGDR